MERFINAVEQALASQNYYAALAMAMALPDMCGRLQTPERRSRERFVDWWERYVSPKYVRKVGAGAGMVVEFLSAKDAYAFRCAYLHEGRDDIKAQSARIALESFVFVEPPPAGSNHCNRYNNVLQLQVDTFCRDICEGATQWLHDTAADEEVAKNAAGLIQLHEAFHHPAATSA